MAKVRTSNLDRTISLKRLQCVVENKMDDAKNDKEEERISKNMKQQEKWGLCVPVI